MLDLREKVRISTGIAEKQQKLAFDANGLTPISPAVTVTPAPTPADSTHDVARPANVLSRRDFQCRRALLKPPRPRSASPGTVQGAGVTLTFWGSHPPTTSIEPTICDTLGTTIPADTLDFAVPTDAQPPDGGGAPYSSLERVQRSLPHSCVTKAGSSTCARWPRSPGRDMQTGTRPLPGVTHWTFMIHCLMTARAP